MNGYVDSFAYWLADFYLLSTVLLAIALAAIWLTRQPVKRLAIAKSVLVSLALLAGLCALPGWSAIHLLAGRASVPTTIVSSPTIDGPVVEKAAPVQPLAAVANLPVAATLPPMTPQEAFSVWAAFSVLTLFGLIHLAGSACVLAWLGLGALAARQLVNGARPAPNELSRLLAEIVPPAGREFDLRVSDQIAVPVAIGVLRPAIVLPSRWAESHLPEELRERLKLYEAGKPYRRYAAE